MLLQTNSYIVPRDKRAEHARLLRRFRQTLLRLGCDHFEVYEQVGANWNTGETTGRFVQIMRFRDRKHQLGVQAAERVDKAAQAVVQEFCELINFPYQQQQGLFAVGFYTSFLRMPPQRTTNAESSGTTDPSLENEQAVLPTPEPGVVNEEVDEEEGHSPSLLEPMRLSTEGEDSENEDEGQMSDEELRRAQAAIGEDETPQEPADLQEPSTDAGDHLTDDPATQPNSLER